MTQIVDLYNDPEFQALDVDFVSIAFDPADALAPERDALGIEIPLLTDATHEVSESYDVLQWAVASGEPGHTFILVDGDGKVVWIRDYGAPQNGGVMYVEPTDLITQIRNSLNN